MLFINHGRSKAGFCKMRMERGLVVTVSSFEFEVPSFWPTRNSERRTQNRTVARSAIAAILAHDNDPSRTGAEVLAPNAPNAPNAPKTPKTPKTSNEPKNSLFALFDGSQTSWPVAKRVQRFPLPVVGADARSRMGQAWERFRLLTLALTGRGHFKPWQPVQKLQVRL
jgi:hypothetical protein